jgi:type II secretory pathway predicted ATPase ExeA
VEHFERFGLAVDPFRNEPQLEFWFGGTPHVAAGRRLKRCIEQGKELCLLVGPVGSGTTTVARALFEQLDPDRFELALLVPLRGVGADELRASLARQLGVDVPSGDRAEGVRRLYGHLVELQQQGRRAVVGIDEAHTLGPEALAELRALLNLEHDDERLLSVLLIGTPALAAAVEQDPGLPGRVELQVMLEPLADGEAQAYLAHRLEAAGGNPALFDAAVSRAIAERSCGLPRRLNALADATLFEAHLVDRPKPSVADVERAARDLPWAHTSASHAGVADVAADADAGADDSSAPLLELTEAAPDDDGLDAPFTAPPALDSLRDADSGSFAQLELPDLESDLGEDLAREVELALAPDEKPEASDDAPYALDHTVRELPPIEGDVLPSEETAPGAWQSPQPLSTADAADAFDEIRAQRDDDATASRLPRQSPAKPSPEQIAMLPDEDELDGLFVDLVEEAEPK